MSSEPNALSVIVEPLSFLYDGLSRMHWSWWFSHLANISAFPMRILMVPVSIIGRILFITFSPVIYVVSFFLAAIGVLFGFIASLEPLYTFFGVAAVIGVFTGLILGVSSTMISSYLGIQDSPPHKTKSSKRKYLQDDVSSSEEADWQYLETSPRYRPASGLLSQTILEEDGSSDVA